MLYVLPELCPVGTYIGMVVYRYIQSVWEVKCEARGRVLYLPHVPCQNLRSSTHSAVCGFALKKYFLAGIQYKALAVPLVRPRKVTNII